MTARDSNCPLCREDGGALLWRGPQLRVIEVDDADYPGFTRIIWHAHETEMTHLPPPERDMLMHTVYAVEQVQREVLAPDKVNLASLGNMVSHVHWHVIPRWRDDRHFPEAIWAAPRVAPGSESPASQARLARLRQQLPHYRVRLAEVLETTHRR